MNYLLVFITCLFFNTSTETHDLSITIDNIEHIGGSIEIGLFNNGEKFLEEGEAYRSISVNVQKSSEKVIIKNLPKGTYAISLYHDKNSNGKCDRNFFGIPKEPYAFSNNFRPKLSAPTFKDCEFTLTSDHTLKIDLLNQG